MSKEACSKIDPARWNRCIEMLCQPLESLNAVQRPAALVFHYDGRVRNGGHSSHFDSDQAAYGDELIEILRNMGAREQARILNEARLLKREADGLRGYEQESVW